MHLETARALFATQKEKNFSFGKSENLLTSKLPGVINVVANDGIKLAKENKTRQKRRL